MYKVIFCFLLSCCLLSGCQQYGESRCLIEKRSDVNQLSVVHDVRIDLAEYEQLLIRRTINGLIFGENETEVSYKVLVSMRSIKVAKNATKPDSLIIYEYADSVKIRTEAFFDIIETCFFKESSEYLRDEAYCPKRISITHISNSDNQNSLVVSNESLEGVWNLISKRSCSR